MTLFFLFNPKQYSAAGALAKLCTSLVEGADRSLVENIYNASVGDVITVQRSENIISIASRDSFEISGGD